MLKELKFSQFDPVLFHQLKKIYKAIISRPAKILIPFNPVPFGSSPVPRFSLAAGGDNNDTVRITFPALGWTRKTLCRVTRLAFQSQIPEMLSFLKGFGMKKIMFGM